MQHLQHVLLKQPSYTAETNRLRQVTAFSKSNSREANTGGNFSQFKVLQELLQYSQQATIGPLFLGV